MEYIEIQTPVGTKLVVIGKNKTAVYHLVEGGQYINESQAALPDGQKIEYEDGSKLIHSGDYLLIRHWPLPNHTVVDRVAFRWKELKVKL